MTASWSTCRTHERKSARKLTVYEVDEFDTIRSLGAKELGVFADAFPAIDPRLLNTAEDVVRAGEDAPPLATRFEPLLSDEVDSQKSLADESGPGSAQGKTARRRLRHLQNLEREGWQSWVRDKGADGLQLLRQTTADWLSTQLRWSDFEWLPYDCGPQGQALSEFEALPREALDELGIKLVYGDRPGSSYYAAELPTDIDEANAVAERLGLDIRFVQQGESAEPFLEGPTPPLPLPDPLTLALERRFVPHFGLLPDIAALVVTDPAQVRTLPPQPLQARHDRVLFQTAWDRIVKAIREPVQVWFDAEGGRHVHVLGIGVYSFDREGVVSCWLWKLDRIGKAKLVSSPTDTVSIDGVPWRWRWLAYWETAFALEVDNATRALGSTTPDETVAAYARWAFKLFRNRIRSGCDLRVMRRRISTALALDGQVLAVARQINMVERRVAVLASQYNQALRHGTAASSSTTAPGSCWPMPSSAGSRASLPTASPCSR